MKKNIIDQFLNSKGKNICFLYSGQIGKNILATKAIDTFSGSSLEKFREFAKKNSKNLLIGYISYDLAYKLYKVKQTSSDDLKLPKIYFHAFKEWITTESKNQEKILFNKSACKSENFKPETAKENYNSAYRKIKNYIKEGDIYQINLTHRLKAKTEIPPRELFLRTVSVNPVEFSAYIEGHNFEILSASPERFIKIDGQTIETCPIKGTRPRGKTKSEDQKQKKNLLESEKEEAELNMITDLLRNDLGKICKIGTVKVVNHRIIKECPTVWHTFSKIRGKLNVPPLEALISMLPGGSITGCPKKRAIEIIDEMEKTTRGVYTGVIGYIMPNKNLDFNIAIRTIIKKGENLYLQVGGGIVMDSKNKDEYKETLDKAKSFMKILQ